MIHFMYKRINHIGKFLMINSSLSGQTTSWILSYNRFSWIKLVLDVKFERIREYSPWYKIVLLIFLRNHGIVYMTFLFLSNITSTYDVHVSKVNGMITDCCLWRHSRKWVFKSYNIKRHRIINVFYCIVL